MKKKKEKDKEITNDIKAQAIAMYRETGNASKVARLFGTSRQRIVYWANSMPETQQRDTGLQIIERNVHRKIENARQEFIESHFADLSEAFRLAITKTKESLKNRELTPLQAVSVAEKIANIIDTMSTTEATTNVQVQNLLQYCINEANK